MPTHHTCLNSDHVTYAHKGTTPVMILALFTLLLLNPCVAETDGDFDCRGFVVDFGDDFHSFLLCDLGDCCLCFGSSYGFGIPFADPPDEP